MDVTDPNGARRAHEPVVAQRADVARLAGERVVIEATLRRTPIRKGGPSATPWLGTALVLADDTIIWVTYGEPPDGWDGFVDRPVRVSARIWDGPSPELVQALAAPHASEAESPVLRVDP